MKLGVPKSLFRFFRKPDKYPNLWTFDYSIKNRRRVIVCWAQAENKIQLLFLSPGEARWLRDELGRVLRKWGKT